MKPILEANRQADKRYNRKTLKKTIPISVVLTLIATVIFVTANDMDLEKIIKFETEFFKALIFFVVAGVIVYVMVSVFIVMLDVSEHEEEIRQKLTAIVGGTFQGYVVQKDRALWDEYLGFEVKDQQKVWEGLYKGLPAAIEEIFYFTNYYSGSGEGPRTQGSLKFNIYKIKMELPVEFDIHFKPLEALKQKNEAIKSPYDMKKEINHTDLKDEFFEIIAAEDEKKIKAFLNENEEIINLFKHKMKTTVGPAELKAREGFIAIKTMYFNMESNAFTVEKLLDLFDYLIETGEVLRKGLG